jgi:hypothetical protein
VAQGAAHLHRKSVVQTIDQVAYIVSDVAVMQPLAASIAGEHDLAQLADRGDHLLVPRQRAMVEVIDLADLVVGLDDAGGDLG